MRFCERNFQVEGTLSLSISGNCVLRLERLNGSLVAIDLLFRQQWEERGLGDLPSRVGVLHFVRPP